MRRFGARGATAQTWPELLATEPLRPAKSSSAALAPNVGGAVWALRL